MPPRKIRFIPGEFYHIYNRGNNYEPIFFERENYVFFLNKAREFLVERRPTASAPDTTNSSTGAVDIIAYCLMPNHYHLLVKMKSETFSKAMQSFSQSYTNAINRRFDRVGSLFQGRFQAIHVEREEYLLHLSRYIHLNPVVAKLVERPEEWEFSSYREYIDLRHGTLPCPGIVLDQFPSSVAYADFVRSGIGRSDSAISHLAIDDG